MNSPAEPLPRFNTPPVVETALGVFFRPMDGFNSAHQGVLWDCYFRADFPKLEERSPIEEAISPSGMERAALPTVRWRISDQPEAPRLWAASESGEHVIQIQRNGFFANWIKASSTAAYLPYSERRREFQERLEQLRQYCRQQEIGELEPMRKNRDLGLSVDRANRVGAADVLAKPDAIPGSFLVAATAGEIRMLRDGNGEPLPLDVVAVRDENDPGHAEIRGPVSGTLSNSASLALKRLFRRLS